LPGAERVRFDLRGVIFLNHDDEIIGLPRSVDGIQIRQKCHRLHFLHATGWQEPENTAIGAYVLHFADGKRQEVPILYGEELRDFNFNGDAKDVRSAKVAWMGQHSTRDHARLFIRTWENPHPEIEIEALDFASKMTKCAPFLVAITAE